MRRSAEEVLVISLGAPTQPALVIALLLLLLSLLYSGIYVVNHEQVADAHLSRAQKQRALVPGKETTLACLFACLLFLDVLDVDYFDGRADAILSILQKRSGEGIAVENASLMAFRSQVSKAITSQHSEAKQTRQKMPKQMRCRPSCCRYGVHTTSQNLAHALNDAHELVSSCASVAIGSVVSTCS